MHIYVERMHALIHIYIYISCFCIIKLFKKKTHTILLEGIKIFNEKIARKLPLVILIGWSLDIVDASFCPGYFFRLNIVICQLSFCFNYFCTVFVVKCHIVSYSVMFLVFLFTSNVMLFYLIMFCK